MPKHIIVSDCGLLSLVYQRFLLIINIIMRLWFISDFRSSVI